ncbi:putative transporter YycB [Lentilactobacillus sunkii]|jgi:CP family cyanate transporter-like MFS transporter|uniref:Putative transporter YycB n=1 Tax=Lentilactobacillus sunkii TaxID=481719 RepID=A0A1E7XBF5_9LACO|nr:MFS transporter [Lentilactobacillus sunkii]OFA10348.1 putative transporter YycB [Lentilactobacillus sunkii]
MREETTVPNRQKVILGALLIFLVGANMRTAITIIPPILTNIQNTFSLPEWFLGSLTTIPLICFGILSPTVTYFIKRFGILSVTVVDLLLLTVGNFIRVYSFTSLLVGTILIGGGIAMLNVLAPTLVSYLFPMKIGTYTGMYVFALSLSSSISAGFSAVVSHFITWQIMIQFVSVIPVITIVVALMLRRYGRKKPAVKETANPLNPKVQVSVWKRPLAWALGGFMGLQSLLFYSILTWLPPILMASGINQNTAGYLLGLLQLVALPISFVVPRIISSVAKQSIMIWTISVLFVIGIGSLMLASQSFWFAVAACVLLGLSTNMAFSEAMTLFSLKTRNPNETASASGMGQSIGYILAATGPMICGWLHGLTTNWFAVLIFLLLVTAVMTFVGLLVDREEYVFE